MLWWSAYDRRYFLIEVKVDHEKFNAGVVEIYKNGVYSEENVMALVEKCVSFAVRCEHV